MEIRPGTINKLNQKDNVFLFGCVRHIDSRMAAWYNGVILQKEEEHQEWEWNMIGIFGVLYLL